MQYRFVSVLDCTKLRRRSSMLFWQQGHHEFAFLQSAYYNVLDSNPFGFGRELNFDSNEFVHVMKMANYPIGLVLSAVALVQEHNCQDALVQAEDRCIEAWIGLFSVVSSNGLQGCELSTVSSDCVGYIINNSYRSQQ